MIRQARSDDLPALLAIQRDAPQAAQWSENSLRDALECCLVAEVDGQPAGFLIYLPIPPDEAELLNLAVAPAHRRSGIATRLIAALAAQTPGSIFLEVRASNRAARALYESLGFVVTAVRRAYYHRPVEDGYLMRRRSVIAETRSMKS